MYAHSFLTDEQCGPQTSIGIVFIPSHNNPDASFEFLFFTTFSGAEYPPLLFEFCGVLLRTSQDTIETIVMQISGGVFGS